MNQNSKISDTTYNVAYVTMMTIIVLVSAFATYVVGGLVGISYAFMQLILPIIIALFVTQMASTIILSFASVVSKFTAELDKKNNENRRNKSTDAPEDANRNNDDDFSGTAL